MLGKSFCAALVILSALLVSSCDIINPEEPLPAYIQVDTVSVNPSDDAGSNSHAINDIWLYVDNKLIGTYEIPFKVPVLPTGYQNVTLEAGIKDSGQGLFRVIYPFYNSYSVDTLLTEAGTIVLDPVYDYEDIEVPLLEDFEGLGNSFERTSSSDTSLMTVLNENCFEGHSGYVVLDSEHPNFDVKTSSLYDLSRTSKVYLELNYYCTDTLTAGLFGREYSSGSFSDVRYPVISLYPTDGKWKKIYINLTDKIADTPLASDYRVFFSASTKYDEGDKSAEIYLDNIKILHY